MEQILLSILTLILAITTYIFKKVIVPYMESKVDKDDMEKIIIYAKIAVSAAEQIFKESNAGREKKEYVKKYLAQMGVKLKDEHLEALIEAAVYELNKAKSEIKETIKKVE